MIANGTLSMYCVNFVGGGANIARMFEVAGLDVAACASVGKIAAMLECGGQGCASQLLERQMR